MGESDQQHGNPGESTTNGWLAWVKEHPAIVGTALYVYVSFIGSTYYWMYLRHFDINFFDFAETNDFLTGAFKDPAAILLGLVALSLFVWSMIALAKSRGRKESPRNRAHFLGPIFLYLIYTLTPGFGLAATRARETRDGWGWYVRVDLTSQVDGPGNLPDSTLMLLGSSDKFIFLWDKSTDKSHVVPIANLARLSVCRTRIGSQRFFSWVWWVSQPHGDPCEP